MPLEKIVALLMALKPVCAAPSSWRRGYIKVFATIATYRWKASALTMELNRIENKADISVVSLRIILKHAYRAKSFGDLVMSLRTYVPELNKSLEMALSGFLLEVEGQQLDISGLPRELFVPHERTAARSMAPSCQNTRKALWDSNLSFESRLALGRTAVAWQHCELARHLNWHSIQDVIAHMGKMYEQVSRDGLFSLLLAKRPELALAKTAFHHHKTSMEHLSELPIELSSALFETGFVRSGSAASSGGHNA
jgi:hypothetical protein